MWNNIIKAYIRTFITAYDEILMVLFDAIFFANIGSYICWITCWLISFEVGEKLGTKRGAIEGAFVGEVVGYIASYLERIIYLMNRNMKIYNPAHKNNISVFK